MEKVADIASPKLVADFLLCESRERGDVLTNLKLQKLLYYAQGWFLALTGRPIFNEDFKAWVHGPVLLSQYHRFKEYAWRPITANDFELPALEATLNKHLKEIVDVFGAENATALELMTHSERPWLEARGNIPMDAQCTNSISKETMRDFYRAMAE